MNSGHESGGLMTGIMDYITAISALVLSVIVPSLVWLGVRVQRQDDTIRRVLELEKQDTALAGRVSDNEREIAVLQARYQAILDSVLRVENKIDRLSERNR